MTFSNLRRALFWFPIIIYMCVCAQSSSWKILLEVQMVYNGPLDTQAFGSWRPTKPDIVHTRAFPCRRPLCLIFFLCIVSC